ncbi:MAG: hypothetical protein M1837_005481 [Sclerophora amabilis]|nr:MAG: hypothetical protein M1837_005481 [Sclerophora amabilis]
MNQRIFRTGRGEPEQDPFKTDREIPRSPQESITKNIRERLKEFHVGTDSVEDPPLQSSIEPYKETPKMANYIREGPDFSICGKFSGKANQSGERWLKKIEWEMSGYKASSTASQRPQLAPNGVPIEQIVLH